MSAPMFASRQSCTSPARSAAPGRARRSRPAGSARCCRCCRSSMSSPTTCASLSAITMSLMSRSVGRQELGEPLHDDQPGQPAEHLLLRDAVRVRVVPERARRDDRPGCASEYANCSPGSTTRKMLSLLPAGDTCMPWKWMFVCASSWLSSVSSIVSPGFTTSVGPTSPVVVRAGLVFGSRDIDAAVARDEIEGSTPFVASTCSGSVNGSPLRAGRGSGPRSVARARPRPSAVVVATAGQRARPTPNRSHRSSEVVRREHSYDGLAAVRCGCPGGRKRRSLSSPAGSVRREATRGGPPASRSTTGTAAVGAATRGSTRTGTPGSTGSSRTC